MALVQTVTITTNGSGAATEYSGPVHGQIISIQYVKNNFDNGVVFAITTETTAQTVWSESAVNASKTVAPRLATHTALGAASLYAGAGEAVLGPPLHAHRERIKIVITSGGNAKSGSFIVTTQE